MDDNTFKALSLVIGLVSTLGLAYISFLTVQSNHAIASAASTAEVMQTKTVSAVKEVRNALNATAIDTAFVLATNTDATTQRLEDLSSVTKATHVLVNSNYGMSLLSTLNALKAVEQLTVRPEDKKAARAAVIEAQRLYDDHISKQETVDATQSVPPIPTTVEKPRPT